LSYLQILAQAATQPASGGQPPPIWADPSKWIFPLLIGVLLWMMLSSSRNKRTEARQREQMLKNLKRGDRVMTAGGMFASIIDVRENEVILKVDESSNTKIKFSRDAIKRVVTEEDSPAK
jgi:preprotein translocase subunit YajC